MNQIIRNLSLAALAGIVMAGCATPKDSPSVLQYVPADTPYVIASTEPMPDSLADKLEPTVDEILEAYQTIVRAAMAEELVELADEEEGAEKAEKLQGLVNEVLTLMSIDGIRGAGVDRESAFALYGNGLLPVLRFELFDTSAFEAAIVRIEGKAEKQLSVGEVEGHSYRYADIDKVRLLIAAIDDYAVVSVAPLTFDDSQLARVLGITKPAESLAQSKELDAIAEKYGFTRYFSGFVKGERLFGTFLDEPTGLDVDLLALFEYDASEISDVCREEYKELVSIVPRTVFGYTEMNDRYIDSLMVFEMREDIAAGLATLPTPVPGLGQDAGGLVSIGLSLDPMAAREFYGARLDAMEADPFECDKLAWLQNSIPQGRALLSQPVPPVVYSFRGLVANITDIKGMDMAQQKPPESLDASFLFAIENAQSIVAMGAMLDPQLAALNLMPDGNPVKLEMAQFDEFADEVWAALSENALVVSMGEGSEANAKNMLVADSADPAPFFSMTMDTESYYNFIGEAMMHAEPDEGEKEMPLAVRTALRDVMTLTGKVYSRMVLNIMFTPVGIEARSRLVLAD